MSWKKLGLVFNCSGLESWAVRGAMIPTPIVLNEQIIRVFCTFLDNDGVGRTGWVDLDREDLFSVIDISKRPVFDIGLPGTFDENGALTCSVTPNREGGFNFYYAGFELGTKIRYRLLTGLVKTDDKFRVIKKYQAPILDRSEEELFFRGGPFCEFDSLLDRFRMWYVGGSEWTVINDKRMPIYIIKYMESYDGIHWPSVGSTCIAVENDDEPFQCLVVR